MHQHIVLGLAAMLAAGLSSAWAEPSKQNDVVLRALEDELKRSMALRLEDLDQPYFIQYAVDDTTFNRISAAYGALLSSDQTRSRDLQSHVRVGSYDLDNSNFTGRGRRDLGGLADLPTDDNYVALRHAVWLATDTRYKGAVEALTQKRAYMRDRTIEDRPPDFTRAANVVTTIQDRVTLSFDRSRWEDYARRISARFKEFGHIQHSDVSLMAGEENRYLVNSEGSRLRLGDTGAILRISAETQAPDGERLSDQLNYFALTPDQLPGVDAILADVQKLADRLAAIVKAPVLEDYTGPVLLDAQASPQFFRQLLGRGVAGQPDPVGSPRRGAQGGIDLENRLGKRILPVTFQIYDDPRTERFQNNYLTGYYLFDDEGVAAQRVPIVVDGKLQGMTMSRAPTKHFRQSTGHGRRSGAEPPRASIGCLYVEAAKGESPEELKKELMDAADAEGLKYGLRITSLQDRGAGAIARRPGGMGGFAGFSGVGGASRIGDPIAVYKVYVADGREELVRGCEFSAVDVRSLRRIIASGNVPILHNSAGGSGAPASSVIAPAVLFEELELTHIKQEAEKKPILDPPHARKK